MHANIIHADVTYKLTREKYPALIFGTTDKDSIQHFHLLGIVISKHEKAADFEFGFKAIKDGIAKIADVNFAPNVLMCDAAPAIHKGFNKAFADQENTKMMCFAHIKAAVERRGGFNKSENKAIIKNNISSLKLSYTKELFDIGSKLFLKKWKKDEPEFNEYFEQVWLKRNKNWFVEAHFRVPNTNNALEGFNSRMKKYHTYWKIKGLAGGTY